MLSNSAQDYIARLGVQQAYIARLGIIIERLAPGKTFSTVEAAEAAVRTYGGYHIEHDHGMPPRHLEECSRTTLYKRYLVKAAAQGYKHVVFAVGPLKDPQYGVRYNSAYYYVVGVIR